MSKETTEQLFAVNFDGIMHEFNSIPACKSNLYLLNPNDINRCVAHRSALNQVTQGKGLLVVRLLNDALQEVENSCSRLTGAEREQVLLPAGWEIGWPNTLKYLKQLAQRMNTATGFYKLTDYGRAHVWDMEAWIFDYTESSKLRDYVFIETIDQGRWLGGYYFQGICPTIAHKVVNGYQGVSKSRPFWTALMDFTRHYEALVWDHTIDWQQRRIKST